MSAGVIVRFTTRWPWNPASLLVARFTGGKQFSHTMLIIDDRVYEASMVHGCRVVDEATAMAGVVAYQDMLVTVPDRAACIAFGQAQAGKPYDWGGALTLPLLASERWQHSGRWWCSELTFAQLGAGGVWILDPDERTRITPNDLHQAAYPKSPLVWAQQDAVTRNPLRRFFFAGRKARDFSDI
jgi:hypothetical protein